MFFIPVQNIYLIICFRDKSGSHYIDKSHPEVNPNTLSVKTSPNLVNSPKRGQKKEDGWKEVIRK